jgi:hypothetical protein
MLVSFLAFLSQDTARATPLNPELTGACFPSEGDKHVIQGNALDQSSTQQRTQDTSAIDPVLSPEEAFRLSLNAGHTPLPSRASTPEGHHDSLDIAAANIHEGPGLTATLPVSVPGARDSCTDAVFKPTGGPYAAVLPHAPTTAQLKPCLINTAASSPCVVCAAPKMACTNSATAALQFDSAGMTRVGMRGLQSMQLQDSVGGAMVGTAGVVPRASSSGDTDAGGNAVPLVTPKVCEPSVSRARRCHAFYSCLQDWRCRSVLIAGAAGCHADRQVAMI